MWSITSMKEIRFSIITVVRDSRDLKDTCKSIWGQDYENFEHVIVYEGSCERINKYPLGTKVVEVNHHIDDKYGSAQRMGQMVATGQYLLYLNPGGVYARRTILRELNDFIRDCNEWPIWFVFPIKRNGRTLFKRPARESGTHSNQICHRKEYFGKEIVWPIRAVDGPASPLSNIIYDGALVEVLNKLCDPEYLKDGSDFVRLVEDAKEDEGYLVGKETDTEDAIVFLTEDTRHITGGRYYSWWLATALKAAGHRVIIYTNAVPVFIKEFEDYPQPEIRVVSRIEDVDVKAKVYIGSPIIGSVMACKLGKKHKRPSYCEIFDPFPMMEKYRGRHHWPGWDELLPLMRKTDCNIISLCNTTSEYIYDWLDKKKDQVFHIYPCINSKESLKARNRKKRDWITFISRLDYHKKLDHVLDAVRETDCDLQVITSVDAIDFPQMVAMRGMDDRVKVHNFVSDKRKFEIIKQSKATINGAIFEGFGMWLTESLSCGVPAVCYEYPTFEEIKSVTDNPELVYFAKYNDPDSLRKKLIAAIKDRRWGQRKTTHKFDFEGMVERMKEIFGEGEGPRVGVVTIALNEEEYVGASLRSMIKMPNVKKVAVVEGATKLYGKENKDRVDRNGLSVDNTEVEVKKVIDSDKENKIIYERHGWAKDKSELRNKCLELLGESFDYIMVVDADEVWKEEDFERLMDYISGHPETSVVWYPAFHFWKHPDLIAVGSQWDKHLFRFFRYDDKSLHWGKHHTPVVNKDGKDATQLGFEAVLDNVHFYHYGAMKAGENIEAKLKYYKARDKELDVKNTWKDWKKGRDTQWTHGGGSTERFDGDHPVEVIDIIEKYI